MIIPQYEAGCPHVTHPSATKLFKNPAEALNLNNFVRLACVKHAASVHPEPGSNSHIKKFFLSVLSDVYPLLFFIVLFLNLELTLGSLINCSVFKDQCLFLLSAFHCQQKLFYHFLFSLSRTFFKFFSTFFQAVFFNFTFVLSQLVALSCSDIYQLYQLISKCQELFLSFFKKFFQLLFNTLFQFFLLSPIGQRQVLIIHTLQKMSTLFLKKF